MQRLHNVVFRHIHDCFSFTPLVRHVQFVKRWCVGAAVGLSLSLEFLDDLHLPQIDNSDCVVSSVGGVELLRVGNVLDTFCTGGVGHSCNNLIPSQIDHICLARR